jgi:hypothetical protein
MQTAYVEAYKQEQNPFNFKSNIRMTYGEKSYSETDFSPTVLVTVSVSFHKCLIFLCLPCVAGTIDSGGIVTYVLSISSLREQKN